MLHSPLSVRVSVFVCRSMSSSSSLIVCSSNETGRSDFRLAGRADIFDSKSFELSTTSKPPSSEITKDSLFSNTSTVIQTSLSEEGAPRTLKTTTTTTTRLNSHLFQTIPFIPTHFQNGADTDKKQFEYVQKNSGTKFCAFAQLGHSFGDDNWLCICFANDKKQIDDTNVILLSC